MTIERLLGHLKRFNQLVQWTQEMSPSKRVEMLEALDAFLTLIISEVERKGLVLNVKELE